MNHAELVEKVAEAIEMPRATASRAVEAVVQAIIDAAKAGDEVRVTGLGIFESSPVRLGQGVTRRLGKASTYPPASRCGFVREKRPKTN